MVVLAGIVMLAAGAGLAWFTSAFALGWAGLGWGHDGRCAATVMAPAVATSALMLYAMFGDRGFPDVRDGWDIVLVVLSLSMGASAGVAALPVWLVLEQNWGWRAR